MFPPIPFLPFESWRAFDRSRTSLSHFNNIRIWNWRSYERDRPSSFSMGKACVYIYVWESERARESKDYTLFARIRMCVCVYVETGRDERILISSSKIFKFSKFNLDFTFNAYLSSKIDSRIEIRFNDRWGELSIRTSMLWHRLSRWDFLLFLLFSRHEFRDEFRKIHGDRMIERIELYNKILFKYRFDRCDWSVSWSTINIYIYIWYRMCA